MQENQFDLPETVDAVSASTKALAKMFMVTQDEMRKVVWGDAREEMIDDILFATLYVVIWYLRNVW
jgi:hypothetical protein